ncbi:MAG: protein-L-isoaspartate(D-aspartate) O-methyltransferase [Calditrichaeota bacterium]|nr:protein-L-isoaspartate(D-aspartate) O-methyltransferase [Calditrichota bacterium]
MYRAERDAMVKYQLEKRGIADRRVIEAMRRLERHHFVSVEEEPYAYEDRPIAIGYRQTISQPYIVALMTQTLMLGGSERVLEIGTGSGYQTALLALLAREVLTIERHPELTVRARKRIEVLEIVNVSFKIGDGTIGWPELAPYDRILVTAGAPKVPLPLISQLEPGGRLVIPVGGRRTQVLKVVSKSIGGDLSFEERGGCLFVPLVGQEGWDSE